MLFRLDSVSCFCCRHLPRLPLALLLFCLLILPPAQVLAQAASDEAGCGCHSAETEAWQDSPHAQAASSDLDLPSATCEDCHGSYVRGHPDDGTMRLTVDSSVCQDCHTTTFGQWDDSVHAQAGVQCIGCHLSHSQTLRLSDQALCVSCHRDTLGDQFHVSHEYADVSCISCHPAPSTSPEVITTASGETQITIPAPDHDFVTIAADNCVSCHSEEIHDDTASATFERSAQSGQQVVSAERVPELTARLEAAESENRSLLTMSVVTLGLGIGVGGVMGMIFVLAVGYVTQRGRRDEE